MKLSKLAGATSEIWQIFIADSSSTTGAGLTGLVFNTASLTAYYHRDTDTTATAITLVTMTVGTFTSSGFKEIDATNMPGWYQFCPPNAAIASGAKSCAFHLKGATNMAPLPIEVQLTAVNPDSATAFITSVASVVGAVGSVTGLTASNLDATISSVKALLPSALAADGSIKASISGFLGTAFTEGAAGRFAANFKTFFNIGSATGTQDVIPTVTTTTTATNLTNAPTAGDLTATMKTSVTTAATAATPIAASVSGAVGSVTGAVGSVTGNVGGNVTGSVGSLAAQAKTDVNAEVVDALNVDTYAEPGQGAPAATASIAAKVGYLYKFLRNKKTQTATTFSLFADDTTTVDQKATTSDDGTTATVGEVASGP